MSEYSSLIGGLSEAATLAVSEKARQLKQAGVDVVNLGGGDPDFTTPDHIIEAALEAMKSGQTHYVASRGIPELREAIAKKLAADNGLQYDPATEIVVTTGARMGIYATLLSLTNPGDEVLVLEPAWVSYKPMVQLAGATPVAVTLDANDDFRVSEDILECYITPRSKALIVNSPNNPTGRVLTAAEWQAIANIADKHNLYVISDEVYEKLLFDGNTHISCATLPELAKRTITVNGFSKTYAMCGWRIGYVAGDRELMSLVTKVEQQVSTCAPSMTQWAGLAALKGPQGVVEEMRKTYQSRRDELVNGLNQIPGVYCAMPGGAFYAFVRFDGLNMSSEELAKSMLDKVAVAAVPGGAFGDAGERYLRLTFAASTESLRKVPGRVADFLRQVS